MTARLITRIFSFFLLASALFDVSCTRVTDLRPEGRGEVVVVCVLTEEATQTLTLDVTDIASPEDRAALSEAEITLFDETAGNEAGRFLKGEGKDWRLEYAAIPEHKYRIVITISGREEISATTTMPRGSQIQYSFGQYYYGTSYKIDSLPEGALWVMGVNHAHGNKNHETADKIATSLTTVDSFNVTDGVFHAVNFFMDSEEEFEFEDEGEIQFYPNVEGQPLYEKMFRIPPVWEICRESKEAMGWFQVAGYFRTLYYPYGFDGKVLALNETDGYVLFISVSEEYDRYLRDVISKRMQQQAMMDYASLFSRENVYSNIANGLGIFGARTDEKLPWNDLPTWNLS